MASLNDDIEKYLKGELTASEMHALEQKALSDPFLAEALEGAANASPHFSLDVELLQQSIRKKSAARHVRRKLPLNGWHLYMGIAAGLLILAVSSFIVLTMMRAQQENKDLAFSKSADTTTLADKVPATPPQSIDSTTGATGQAGPLASSTRPVERVQLEKPTSRNEYEVEANLHEPPVISKRTKDSIANTLTTSREAGTTPGAFATVEKTVKGKVVSSEDGSELAGVNVMIKGTNKGTISDAQGNFEIGIPEGSDVLLFSFIGLESHEAPVNDTSPIVVKMKADATQLTEMVVTGQEVEWNNNLEFPFMEMAEPRGGRNAFKKYLTDKMQYPYQALSNKVQGGVTVQFTVLPSGQLVDFKVLDGLGYGCDEEVIRLIKEGPSWVPSRLDNEPVKEDVQIRLVFDLPERK